MGKQREARLNAFHVGRRDFLAAASALAAAALTRSAYAADEAPVKIGLVGTGRLGSLLGEMWLKAGHEIMLSSLDLEHDKALAARLGRGARAGTPREAAAFGDVVLVSVPYSGVPQVGKEIGDLVKGKIVIDTSNPVPARDGEIANWARQKGAGLATAELIPGARLVRAFNAIGSNRLPDAAKRGGVGMPMAGDDAGALAVASKLVKDIGLEPVVVGPLAMGKYLMPGTPLAGEHSAEELKRIAAGLKP